MGRLGYLLAFVFLQFVSSHKYDNSTLNLEPVQRQLLDFKLQHPVTVGLLSLSTGKPVEIRETNLLNSEIVKPHYIELQTHNDAERIPERIVHAKATGAYGYFEVTNDVSEYTSADVFNGIGKKTPVVTRFSTAIQNLGGHDLGREQKAIAMKFYTKEGNLDLLCLNQPVYFYKDPVFFTHFVHMVQRNMRTNMYDFNMVWDFITLKPETLHGFLWLFADRGIPNGYRRMDVFPIHTYEVTNKHGERHYIKFNFRTEQGLENLTSAEAAAIRSQDSDYYNRDLYNAIEQKQYPSWRLEFDVMTKDDIKNIDYDPFDVTRIWKRGTYRTVTVGRLVINRNPTNIFKDVELGAYNPANLVPGIPGPVDKMFKGRIIAYRDTQNYRLGINHNKIEVNAPAYAPKTYNRNGKSPVRDNMEDVPPYYPDSFSGPMPYVDETYPSPRLELYQSFAVDLEPLSDFYNNIIESNAHRQRIADNIATSLNGVVPEIVNRTIWLLNLVDRDLGRRVNGSVTDLQERARRQPRDMKERIQPLARCIERNT